MSDTQRIYRVRDAAGRWLSDPWISEAGPAIAEALADEPNLFLFYADVEWKPMPPDGDEPSRMRPIEADFYFDRTNQVWVYRWSDDRLVLRDAPELMPPQEDGMTVREAIDAINDASAQAKSAGDPARRSP